MKIHFFIFFIFLHLSIASDPIWGFFAGSSDKDQYGYYGWREPKATPGGRHGAISWGFSTSKNYYMFGGEAVSSSSNSEKNDPEEIAMMNDLWQWDGEYWTWLGGSNLGNDISHYNNTGGEVAWPSSRKNALYFRSLDNNYIYLMGGFGCGGVQESCTIETNSGYLNDLWQWDGRYWKFISGASHVDAHGHIGYDYHYPGGRSNAAYWGFGTTNYVYGGVGCPNDDETQCSLVGGLLSDLWQMESGEWYYLGGSNSTSEIPKYGEKKVFDPENTPGARHSCIHWSHKEILYLFGGFTQFYEGLDRSNDLWEYSTATHTWAWVGGPTTPAEKGVYGEQGVYSPNNWPGARDSSFVWSTTSTTGYGELVYMLGGFGHGKSNSEPDFLNDIWVWSMEDPHLDQFAWIGGSDNIDNHGTYEPFFSKKNIIGARRYATGAYFEKTLFLFGGHGYGVFVPFANQTHGYLNDLFLYTVPPPKPEPFDPPETAQGYKVILNFNLPITTDVELLLSILPRQLSAALDFPLEQMEIMQFDQAYNQLHMKIHPKYLLNEELASDSLLRLRAALRDPSLGELGRYNYTSKITEIFSAESITYKLCPTYKDDCPKPKPPPHSSVWGYVLVVAVLIIIGFSLYIALYIWRYKRRHIEALIHSTDDGSSATGYKQLSERLNHPETDSIVMVDSKLNIEE